MKKKVISMLLAAAMITAMTAGCGNSSNGNKGDDAAAGSETDGAGDQADASDGSTGELENVSLTMWGAEEDQAMLQEMIDAFKEEYKDKANFDIKLGVCSESEARDNITTEVESAPDVYAFASDQIQTLLAAGALQEITLNAEGVIEANGGADAGAVKAATIDGKLYAYPETADNWYFMFYNKEYFTEDDIKSLDQMMKIAADNGKKITLDYTSGWYLWSFFGGAGFELTLNEDRSNTCNINGTSASGVKGTDVLQGMIDVCKNPGFISLQDAEFVTGLNDGSIIAGINGSWNAEAAQKAWVDNYAAAKLPTFTCGGQQVQMGSFAGYKLVGVNPYSKNVGHAMMLADWITNEANQTKRFEVRGACPSNVKAAEADAVQQNIALAAISAQSQYAVLDGVQSDNYWDPMTALGGICIDGNSNNDDLQKLLDNAVEGITQPVAGE